MGTHGPARGVAVALVRYRADRGLPREQLGGLLGMTQPQVARLERGDTNPSMETLMRLAVVWTSSSQSMRVRLTGPSPVRRPSGPKR